MAGCLGKFICIDDFTASGTSFDVVRLFLKVPINSYLQDHIFVENKGKRYNPIIREECDRLAMASGMCSFESSDSEHDYDNLGFNSESDESLLESVANGVPLAGNCLDECVVKDPIVVGIGGIGRMEGVSLAREGELVPECKDDVGLDDSGLRQSCFPVSIQDAVSNDL